MQIISNKKKTVHDPDRYRHAQRCLWVHFDVMTIKDMSPAQSVNSERKFVEKLVGTKITLDLPLDINKASYNSIFNFSLKEIQSKRQVGAGDFLLLPLYVLTSF